MAYRQRKAQLLHLLRSTDPNTAFAAIGAMPAAQVISPLFGLLCHGNPLVRWRAVDAMGAVTADVSRSDPEAGRVVMRRLMWHLNDESGGIGWGAPEAMGDIMARHRGLAGAYASILICYIDPRGNYLDHPGLQAGVLWAVGRLARAWPDLVQSAADLIRPFLNDPAVKVRGMAVWAALPLNDTHLTACMRALRNDPAEFELYEDHHLVHRRISELVQGLFSSVLIR